MQQLRQPVTLGTAQPDVDQPSLSAAEMASHQHFPQAVQRTPQWSGPATGQPRHKIHLVIHPLVVQTHLLQIKQQSLLRVPEAVNRIRRQLPQRRPPLLGLTLSKTDRPLQPLHQQPNLLPR